MARLDGPIVRALAQWPALTPRADFADRVMRQVSTAPRVVAVADPVGPTPREAAARRRLFGGALVAGGALVGGFAWAAANPGAALRWVTPGLRTAGESLWLSLQTLSANASEQPWHASLSEALATPSRVVLTACIAGALYAAALVGFRHLLTEPAPDATV